jgi:hypothetical protein
MILRIVVLAAALASPAAARAQPGGTPHASLPDLGYVRELILVSKTLAEPNPAPATSPTPPVLPDYVPPLREPCAIPLAGTGPREFTVVTGQVTSEEGVPERQVVVRIECLNVAAATGDDGRYRIVIPGTRMGPGAMVRITASRPARVPIARTITLRRGAETTHDFRMVSSVPEYCRAAAEVPAKRAAKP